MDSSTTVPRLAISIRTLGECLRHGHRLAAFCPVCQRWTQLDLARLVKRGFGARPLTSCRVRCRVCGGAGRLQLRAPVPGWDGPAAHGAARPTDPTT
jgi:hypothetical protein